MRIGTGRAVYRRMYFKAFDLLSVRAEITGESESLRVDLCDGVRDRNAFQLLTVCESPLPIYLRPKGSSILLMAVPIKHWSPIFFRPLESRTD